MDGITIGAVVGVITLISGLVGLYIKIRALVKEQIDDSIAIANSEQDKLIASLIEKDKLIDEFLKDQNKEALSFSQHSLTLSEQRNMMKKIDDLHAWHDVSDSDGVKIWYVRRSLEDAIEKLSESIIQQTRIFDRLMIALDHKGNKDN